jgi:Restriction Enzyme Adenine Methylase Associated
MGYQIEIDFEVNQKIWAERKSEEESDNDVIRRLLRMPARDGGRPPRPSEFSSDESAWVWKGVTLSARTQLRMDYLGQRYEGEVRGDGKWWVGERFFTTPSEAAKSLARTREGKTPSLDGWKYWYVKRPLDQDWIPLDDLRKGLGNGRSHKPNASRADLNS